MCMCIFLYICICIYLSYVRCKHVLFLIMIVTRYHIYASGNHSCLPRSSIYETANNIPMEPSIEIQIRFATRAVYSYFDSRHTDVFCSEAFLEAAIDCRYSSFRFLFPPFVMLLFFVWRTFLRNPF